MTSTEQPIHLLLVDDLEENLLALEALLKSEGVVCLKARSGDEALELCWFMMSPWPCSTCRCLAWTVFSWPSSCAAM